MQSKRSDALRRVVQVSRLDEFLDALTPEQLAALQTPIGRKAETKWSPMLFALTYLPHLLKDPVNGEVTMSEMHWWFADYGRHVLAQPLVPPRGTRSWAIAPRESAKSTWAFLILPLWLAAHDHRQFIAAFSSTSAQAEGHLARWRKEINDNALLREDYPLLCMPERVGGKVAADRSEEYRSKSGFTFIARGVASGNHGMVRGSSRPQVLLLDDVEPGEGEYSLSLAKERKHTLLEDILPLGGFAHVLGVGTVTMAGSINHQLVRVALGEDADELDWIKEAGFRVKHFPALRFDQDGNPSSLWPEKWPVDFLLSLQGTRDFQKNFQCVPLGSEDGLWRDEHFHYKDAEDEYAETILSVDPAVTANKKSDFTGLAVLSKHLDAPKVDVRYANHARAIGLELKAKISDLLEAFPEIGTIVVETNQGGDTWRTLLSGLPVVVKTVHQKVAKVQRWERALVYYERNQVFHTGKFHVAEAELMNAPHSPNDDITDAITTGILYFANKGKKKRRGHRQGTYV